MQPWEVTDIIDNIEYLDRNTWEQTRINTYVLAQVNSKNKIDKNSFISFAWDKDNLESEEHNYEISNAEIERLKELSKRWQK